MGHRWGRGGDGGAPPDVDPAFVEFVAARSAALFRTAVLITGDRHSAEDLVQSALERAFRNWERVASVDAPEAYVRRILANLAVDHLRTRGRAGTELLDHDGHDRAETVDAYRGVEEREAIVSALRELPLRMRTVLVLRYFDDMTEAQIADALGIAAGTVKSQAARGLAKLRAAMAGAEAEAEQTATAHAPSTIAPSTEPIRQTTTTTQIAEEVPPAESGAGAVIPFPQGGAA